MERTYLNDINIKNSTKFKIINETFSSKKMYTLKKNDEIDIFSNLPEEVFNDGNEQQCKIMKLFRQLFYNYASSIERTVVLPKMNYYVDSEGASIIQLASSWDGGNATVYISFERDETESSFGMIWNDKNTKDYETRSGNIALSKENDFLIEIINFIFRVY